MNPSLILAAWLAVGPADDGATTPDYAADVAPVLKKYCAGCHNDEDREGEFSVESHAGLLEGPALKPGDAANSRMIRLLTGAAKPLMPPKGEPRPNDAEVATLRRWIDAGAKGSKGEPADRMTLVVPSIPSNAKVRPLTAIDVSPDGRRLAVARYASVEIHAGTGEPGTPERVLDGFPGKVTSVHFSKDGTRLVTASGVVGLGGVASLWDPRDGSLIRRFAGHRDLLFDAELSPDGNVLATSGYDRAIRLWDVATGNLLRTLEGHNGAVYDLAFSPDGRTLVSASADDTCKVWRVADGMRLDTLPQPLKEEYACAFSPDGRSIVAGGADNTIRVWAFEAADRPRINPMTVARFAHEGPIVRLAFTPDGSRLVTTAEDRTIKVWDTADYSELQLWEHEPDVATALAVAGDGRSFRVGRMDGSSATYALPEPRDRSQATPGPGQAWAAVTREMGELRKASEREPNDQADRATDLEVPAVASGLILGRTPNGLADTDLYRFTAKAGERWVVEVDAARSGSKLDSFVEVLDARGGRIDRVKLQAVRDSYFTFRGKDDSAAADFRLFNQDEMHLNEYLYANGEILKLWLYPRGPDSGFLVYPGAGKRRGYFDTTPLTHALGEPCYVVEAHPPGTPLIPNGLPVFTLGYENDDEAGRELGKDSKLTFTAPADGAYLVRIRDVRGLEGPDFQYALTIRPSRPDFQVDLKEPKGTINPGGSQEFRVSARRLDGYEGPIVVEVDGLPPGFTATSPIVIEAGQSEAIGLISARMDAPAAPTELARVKASATIDGREVSHPVKPLGLLKRADKPQLRLTILPSEAGPRPIVDEPGRPLEFAIPPGRTIELKVRVDRNGHVGQVPLGNEGAGRNLPFGVIVDNLGLNGLLITEKQDERTFFVTADRSATPQARPFHLTTTAAGGQSSLPVILHVRPEVPSP